MRTMVANKYKIDQQLIACLTLCCLKLAKVVAKTHKGTLFTLYSEL